MHGWAIAQRIRQVSRNVLQVNQGALYPALHRLEQQGWIRAEWRESENNRRAKYYALTADGKKYFEARRSELGPAVCGHWTGSGKGMRSQEVRDAVGAENPIAGAIAVPQERGGCGTERRVAVSPRA
jgi:transcriptional regulator